MSMSDLAIMHASMQFNESREVLRLEYTVHTRPGRYDDIVKAMNSIGWFMPPYGNQGQLDIVSREINNTNGRFDEFEVERVLGFFYTPDRLASMVINMYAQMPVVDLYKRTIAESIAAHFSGLHHVAVAGLMPVVEGTGRELARTRGCLKHEGSVKAVFIELITNAKKDAWARKIGNTQEIDDMLTGSLVFLTKYFFENSALYPLWDKTNRHGVLHGAYRDSDYGRPINFYKTISAVDILTFVSMLQTNKMTGFVPAHTADSRALAERYSELKTLKIL
jgi:hypothetical protein